MSTSFPSSNPNNPSEPGKSNISQEPQPDDEKSGKARHFNQYFTLEEAASKLPKVRETLQQARQELETVKDSVILFKRILLSEKREGKDPSEEALAHLKERYEQVEAIYDKWIQRFSAEGILLRDLAQGLIDFPYYSKSLDEEFLLCWKLGEDGLFYFHPLDTGFGGRQPISLLPD